VAALGEIALQRAEGEAAAAAKPSVANLEA